MPDDATLRFLKPLERTVGAPMFLSGFFQTPPENFHLSEKVTSDVIRNEPRIAVPVKSLKSGARQVELSKFVNKEYLPAILDLETSISVWETIKRQAGEDPFEDPDFLRNAGKEAMRTLRELVSMQRRSVELQCAQIFNNGVISSVDEDGNVVYTLDYQMKNSHIATVGTDWAVDGSTGDPEADIKALAEIFIDDGKVPPTDLVFGSSAWQRFEASAKIKTKLDNRRMNQGEFKPEHRGQGATPQGFLWIGDYRFDLWTYRSKYIHPQTGSLTPYVATDKMLMLSKEARYDLTFGEIPRFVKPGAEVQQIMPDRLMSTDGAFDVSTFMYVTPNGKQLILEAGTRPLAIPTEIDAIASLDVVQ